MNYLAFVLPEPISRLISIVDQAPVTVAQVSHCQVCEKVGTPNTHEAGLEETFLLTFRVFLSVRLFLQTSKVRIM